MEQVIDKYQIEEEIDKEALGVIYRAKDLETERIVELGIVDASLSEFRREIEELLAHKQVISRVDHLNIAKLYDFFPFENKYILVREYLPSSQTLSEWIHADSHSFEEIGKVVCQICDALKYANENGVAYNYIIPSAIKIDPAGHVKITNLGFSKLFRASYSGSESIIESANFLSPEQIQELPSDVRSDVYSMGVLLYVILTKSLPFPGKNFAKIIAQKIHELPDSPEKVEPRVPKILSEVVMQAIQPEREARFPTIDEFRERLTTALKQAERGTAGRHVGQKFGHYEVIEILGHGAHSTVFKAIDTRVNKLVALKMLDYRLSMDEQFVKRFDREGVISERLDHPNIVKIVEKFEHEEFFFMAIEYVDGVPLDKMFEKEEPLPFEKTFNLFKQICDAFDYVHNQGVVHRDIKPSNIVISPDGVVKVLDFGIAKILDAATESLTQSPIGTPQYMSPEQCSSGEVDSRTDIYALGILLFKMLTGRVPFSSDKLHILLKKHISEEPPLPSSLNPAVPEELDGVVLKAIRKEREDRFSSVWEMFEQFSAILKPMISTGRVGKNIGPYNIMSVGKRRGGMAETFIAKEAETGNLVFIKMVHRDLAADPILAKRFRREIDVLRKMDHPNIVKVVDVVEEQKSAYLVMDYITGKDLGQMLDDRRVISPPEALPIFIQTCNAIEYAHAQDIVHRDIKPANIMLDPDGRVIVLDFGIAKILDPGVATLTMMPIGTPAYMSPEQFTLDDITPQSDIYSLGILLYELLTGLKPFETGTGKYRQKHLTEPPVPLTKRGNIHKKVSKVVLKALEKKPEDRYQDVASFRDEYEKVVRKHYVDKTPLEIKHDAPKRVSSGDTVTFQATAPSGGHVSVKVDGVDRSISLEESRSEPGKYSGTYSVQDSDRAGDGTVTAYYDYVKPKRVSGKESERSDITATLYAQKEAKESVKIDKRDPRELATRAREYYDTRRYGKALKAATEATRQFPQDGEAEKIRRLSHQKIRKTYKQFAMVLAPIFLALIAWAIYATVLRSPITIESVSPRPGEISMMEGDSQTFVVEVASSNEGDLNLAWSLDEEEAMGGESSYEYSPGLDDSGTRELALKISDTEGREKLLRWTIEVEDLIPVLAFTPAAGETVEIEGGNLFEITVDEIDFPLPQGLSFEWYVDGSPETPARPHRAFATRTERIPMTADPEKREIRLEVTGDTLEETLTRRWTLNVVPRRTLEVVKLEPSQSRISLMRGRESTDFVAQYRHLDREDIFYEWFLADYEDGLEGSEEWMVARNRIAREDSYKYTYRSRAEDGQPKILGVRVSDGTNERTHAWNIKFVDRNPFKLVKDEVDPPEGSVPGGGKMAFSVRFRHDDAGGFKYVWSEDGTEKTRETTGKYTYQPRSGDKLAKRITVYADDGTYESKPVSWVMDFGDYDPLKIAGLKPEPGERAIPLDEGEKRDLSVKAEHDLSEILEYEWSFVGDDPKPPPKNSDTYTYVPGYDLVKQGEQPRTVTVRVVVRDEQGREKEPPRPWRFSVADTPLLRDDPRISDPAEVTRKSVRGGQAGRIVITEGRTLRVQAPLRADNRRSPDCTWDFELDGRKKSAKGGTFEFALPWDRASDRSSEGRLTLVAHAKPDDPRTWAWDVTVENTQYVNRPPEISEIRGKSSIKEGETATFEVVAHDPDGQDLDYEFYFKDEPGKRLPSNGNKYTLRTDSNTVKAEGRKGKVTRILIAKVWDNDEFQKESAKLDKPIDIWNAVNPPKISRVTINGMSIADAQKTRFDVGRKFTFEVFVDDPDHDEGDEATLAWTPREVKSISSSKGAWSPTGPGPQSFKVTATDSAGETDTEEWKLTIVDEKAEIEKVLRSMVKAYDDLDFQLMQSLSTGKAVQQVAELQKASQYPLTGYIVEYQQPVIDGQEANVLCRRLKYKLKGKEIGLDTPIEQNQQLKKVGGDWKVVSLY